MISNLEVVSYAIPLSAKDLLSVVFGFALGVVATCLVRGVPFFFLSLDRRVDPKLPLTPLWHQTSRRTTARNASHLRYICTIWKYRHLSSRDYIIISRCTINIDVIHYVINNINNIDRVGGPG